MVFMTIDIGLERMAGEEIALSGDYGLSLGGAVTCVKCFFHVSSKRLARSSIVHAASAVAFVDQHKLRVTTGVKC